MTGERKQHPNERKKLREKRLARRNSTSAKAGFKIEPEDYVDKLLIFDLNKTGEEEVFN